MKKILEKVNKGNILTEVDVNQILSEIVAGTSNSDDVKCLLKALAERKETADEIASFAKFMRQNAKNVSLKSDSGLIDVCGTGGDCLGTFNISTAVSFVIAGAGAKLIKHGNRSVSSKSGSADVLEKLGVSIEMAEDNLQKILNETGMVFLFAPNYHPSMAKIKEIRKNMGIPTVFNLLGPLTNPVNLDYQVIGVYDKDKCEIVANALLKLGIKEAMVVYGADGLDEISTTGENIIFHIKNGTIDKQTLSPEDVGLKRSNVDELLGADAVENAQIILEILQGKKGAKRDIVLLNSAAALVVCGIANDFIDGIKKAEESIDSGAAQKVLEKLKNVSG